MIHVVDNSLASVSQARDTSPISLGEESLTNLSHVGHSPASTACHDRGIDIDQKPRHKIFNPKFPCKICKGDHITHLCLEI